MLKDPGKNLKFSIRSFPFTPIHSLKDVLFDIGGLRDTIQVLQSDDHPYLY